MRGLALREAYVEYAEYYFLFPLFLSITLLTSAGFFDRCRASSTAESRHWAKRHVAFAQFLGCTFLSAILDNNIVADFASRGLHGLSIQVLHFFAMAQIVGYALGGCWTHIGCAQSVVAFAFIQRDVDAQLYARPVDQGNDSGHRPDSGTDGRAHLRRKRRAEMVLGRRECESGADHGVVRRALAALRHACRPRFARRYVFTSSCPARTRRVSWRRGGQ